MKRSVLTAGLVMIAMLVSVSAEAQWVFVARKAMGKIKQLQSEHADVATVILEAGAKNVYKKALATIEANPDLKIVKRDDAAMTLAFSEGKRKAMMKVEELGDKVSEILISASPAKGKQGT